MNSLFRAIVDALPGAATNIWSLCAYGLTLATWAIVAWRVQRNRNLLKNIESFPPADRLKALRSEMEVPEDISPEVWLRSRARRYIFLAIVAGIGAAAVVVVVAILHRGNADEVKVSDITATLTVDSGEQGNPCPPPLLGTTLHLVGAARHPEHEERVSWDDDELAPIAELKLEALGFTPIRKDRGEIAHEVCDWTTTFTGFSGSVGILKLPNRWKGAWLEATIEGEGEGAEWDEFYNDNYLPGDQAQLQEDFRKFYGLTKRGAEFGQSTGLEETIIISVNGKRVGSASGIVARSGVGFHGIPETYTVKFRPFPVASSVQVLK